jgi:hypothetical protein
MENTNRISDGSSKRNRLLWRHECSWKNKIKIDIKEVTFESVDCINLPQGRSLVNSYEQFNNYSGSIKTT